MHPPDDQTPATARLAGGLAIDLALRLTLLDLLLRPVGNWAIRPLILALAVIALLNSNWLRKPQIWFALATLAALRVWLDWPMADNHAYLLAYWCLAVALACTAANTQRVPGFNGRLLIGLVFLFSCLWKFLVSDHYIDGTFFKVIFLADPRFEGLVRVVGGLDVATVDQLREFVTQHRDLPRSINTGGVALPTRFLALAYIATGWNLFINAALAVSFLWPGRPGIDNLRHILLLVYCSVTYAIATVDGFGWLLLAMGVSLCTFEQRRTRVAYVAVFVLIIFYGAVPWADYVFLPLLFNTGIASF